MKKTLRRLAASVALSLAIAFGSTQTAAAQDFYLCHATDIYLIDLSTGDVYRLWHCHPVYVI